MLNYSNSENTTLQVIAATQKTTPLSRKKFNLSTQFINRLFIVVISLFAICHSIAVYFDYGGVVKTPLMKIFAKLFNLNSERGVPNFFSALILLTASLLLYFIYKVIHRSSIQKNKTPWRLLSFIFLYLCIDETFSIHEQLIPVTQTFLGTTLNGFLHWAWIAPYAVLMIVITVYFWKFVMRLPVSIRNLFFLSCFIYVTGALGVEMIEGYTYEQQMYVFNEILVLLQEVMEMAGIALFIHALLKYIRMRSKEVMIVF